MDKAIYLSGITQMRVYRIVQNTVGDIVKNCGLDSVSEWFILCHVANEQHVRAIDMANLLDVEPPLITTLTNALIAKNLLVKDVDPRDKRVKFLRLTKEGRSVVPKVENLIRLKFEQLLQNIDQEDLSTYEKVIETIIRNAEKARR